MTFATRILGQSVGLFYYCRISGLPGIWGTCEDPGWDGWSPMLLADGLDEPIEEALEVWAGISAPSSVTLSIAIDEAWRLWLNRDVYGDETSTVAANLPPDYVAALELVSADSFASSVAYVGLETIGYTGTTATSLTGLTRGLYGSHAQYHVAEWDGADDQSYLGAYVSNRPLVFAGRTLELWVGTYPTNAAPFSTDDRLVFKGIVESVKLSDDLTTIKVAANDIISLVESSAASRLPRARVKRLPGNVWIDEWSCEMGINIPPPGFDAYGSWRINPKTRLSALEPDGIYSFEQVADALGAALINYIPKRDVTVTIEPRELDDGGVGTRIIFSTPLAQGPFPKVMFNATPRSLWAELGFEGTCEASGVDPDGDDVYRLIIDSEKPMPAFRRPPGATRPIWYEQIGTLAFAYNAFKDLDGANHGKHVRIGEQISRWSGIVEDSTTGLVLSGYEFGSSSAEQDEPEEIVQGLALQDIEWPLVILHLLCGGRRDNGTYSHGPWLGACGMVPEALVDIDSFESAAATADRVSVWVDKATTIRELIEPLLVTYQYGLLTRDGKITLVQVPLGLVSEPSVWDLDHDDIDTSAGIQWDIPEDLIVATIKADNVGYNWGAESGQGARTLVNGTSLATWGGSSPLEVDMRAQRGEYLATDAVFRLADDLWPRWGGPFAVVTMSIASAAVWTLEIGDAVTITHTLLPDYARQYHTPSGTWRVQGWVYRRAPIWRGGSNRGTITVVVPGVDGARMSGWAPTARSTGALGAKTIPLDDASHFRADDAVRAYKEGDEDSAVTGTIGSIIGSVITIDSTGTLTHPVCVEFDDWTVAVERQKGYVYVGRRYHYA